MSLCDIDHLWFSGRAAHLHHTAAEVEDPELENIIIVVFIFTTNSHVEEAAESKGV